MRISQSEGLQNAYFVLTWQFRPQTNTIMIASQHSAGPKKEERVIIYKTALLICQLLPKEYKN